MGHTISVFSPDLTNLRRDRSASDGRLRKESVIPKAGNGNGFRDVRSEAIAKLLTAKCIDQGSGGFIGCSDY